LSSENGGGHGNGNGAGQPVVIGGAPHGEEEGGEGNWLVSYADMMTLLVGFFVILLSFSNPDQAKFDEMRKAVAAQFGGSFEVPYGEIANRMRDALNKLGLGDQVVIKTTDLGVEISFLGTVFFDTGSAEIKAEATTLLKQIIPQIQNESKDFNVVIEGHTDDIPIRTGGFKNNWELSSMRACRVLGAFEEAGYAKLNLTAVGYGDARPTVPNRDAAGNAIPQNQGQNRRVVIKLLKKAAPSVGAEALPAEPHPE
jgi:chemotaxis protein MotB